jgi:drug/metabolite transporter (DMT)-like permease
MTGVAVGLVLISALLHAVWNLFNKGSGDRWAFFFGQGLATLVVYGPLFCWFWPGHIAAIGWAWIAASAMTHAAYAVFLLKSYDAGDLSVAYPLSRTAPILVAMWDALTARGQLSVWGFLGALLAGGGAVILQLPALRARGGRAVLGDKVTRYALTTAVFVAAFTVIDKHGVAHVPPFIYLYLLVIGEFSVIGTRLGGRVLARVGRELRVNGAALIATGLLGPFAYLLILWVLQQAPASYVLGLRQTSIVFGVVLGRIVLQEGETRYRLAGAAVIAAGGLLIAAAG